MRLHLTRLLLNRSQARGSFVGDRCPVCQEERRQGTIGVYCTKLRAGKVIRYLSCNACGWKPNDNKWVEDDPGYQGDIAGQRKLPFGNDDEADEPDHPLE